MGKIIIIERLERAKERGLNNGLYKRYPELLESINYKIEALKNGLEYNIIDKTELLKTAISYNGGKLRDCNISYINGKSKLIKYKNSMTWKVAESISKAFNKNKS